MRKLILLLTLLILLFIPNHVWAQNEIHLYAVGVDIWPEYDQFAVLTIYRITLAPGTILPASLSMRIPSDAQINAVAVVDPSRGLINTPYDNTVQSQWSVLKITANSLEVQVEFYEPIKKNGSARHIVFEWYSDYEVDELEVNFLRPLGADNVSISLSPVDISSGQDGLTNYRILTTNLAPNHPFILTIDYQRKTDDLSISSLPVLAASTPGADTLGRVSMTDIFPWVLAGIGVLLIAAGIAWFIVWRRSGHSSTVSEHEVQIEENGDEFRYCPQCGKRAQAGDIFCRTCGSRLKR
jgi:hypothetical protein